MSKLFVRLGRGDLLQGCPDVIIELFGSDNSLLIKEQCSLDAAPYLGELYIRWQIFHQHYYEFRRLSSRGVVYEDDEDPDEISNAGINNFSEYSGDELNALGNHLVERFNKWLGAGQFSEVERRIRDRLHPSERVLVIIETEDEQLRKLPWWQWRFFEAYRQAGITLSPLKFKKLERSASFEEGVRILGILGDDEDIDIEPDRIAIQNLPGAIPKFLCQPSVKELHDALWEQRWDILFFAGHSYNQGRGYIKLNRTTNLTITEFKNALTEAIKKGLKLAIFNSCDGLGLARDIAELNLPAVIVMREPVPNGVAQKFLRYFLQEFSGRNPLDISVMQAQRRLQDRAIEKDFPCASLLPTLVCNPTEELPTWEGLYGINPHSEPSLSPPLPRRRKPKFRAVVLASLVITVLVMGVRWLGVLQTWELKAFDHLMQMRPREPADERLLIIGADEKDIRTYGHPLPDAILAQLFDKLRQYQPAVIGLDIIRDHPKPKDDLGGHKALVTHFKQYQNLIAVCAFNNNTPEQSIAPLPESPKEQLGFINLYDDLPQTNNQDDTVRRYLLSRTENPISKPSRCTTPYSLSWQLLYLYLKAKKIPVEVLENNWKFGRNGWKFGEITFKRLETRTGGYQNLDAAGDQLLINYRKTTNPQEIARQVTVRDVLNNDSDRFDPAWVQNRVVLIGVVASSVPDPHYTPYGKMRGLYIHAHVVSQILSAIEEDRPMLWWLPQWGDTLWVLFWSFTGAVIVWRFHVPLHQGLMFCISIITLYGLCWGVLTIGGWLPLIPSALALVFPWLCLLVYSAFPIQRNH
jgi:CHASE2 domain-containing sensor protein